MARDTVEIIAEEMRRLDPDEVYAEVVQSAPGAGSRGSPRMSAQEVVVHRDSASLCETAADRLITRVVDAQAAQGTSHVLPHRWPPGLGVLAAVRASSARDAVDWRRLDLWWSDERFLPAGDPERNDTGAYAALLDHVPLDPARVHTMPTPARSRR